MKTQLFFHQPLCPINKAIKQRSNIMAIAQIKAFSEQAKTDPELKEKLLAVQKIRELIALGKDYGFELDEVELYPPNEPQFVEEQLSERMAKALLRV
jgi:predicted ribosomally synthesized peptide with nif11-like leader